MTQPLRLNIKVVEATNIPKMDIGFSSADPYCKVFLKSRPKERFKTTIKKNTLKPVWREPFQFELSDDNDTVCFVLMDWDRSTKDDKIATLDLDVRMFSPGVAYEKWFPMVPEKGIKTQPRIRLMCHRGLPSETPFLGPDGNENIIYPQTQEEWEQLSQRFLNQRQAQLPPPQ